MNEDMFARCEVLWVLKLRARRGSSGRDFILAARDVSRWIHGSAGRASFVSVDDTGQSSWPHSMGKALGSRTLHHPTTHHSPQTVVDASRCLRLAESRSARALSNFVKPMFPRSLPPAFVHSSMASSGSHQHSSPPLYDLMSPARLTLPNNSPFRLVARVSHHAGSTGSRSYDQAATLTQRWSRS